MDITEPLDTDVRVDLRRVEPRMTEHLLDAAKVGATLHHVRGASVPEEVAAAASADACLAQDAPHQVAERLRVEAGSVASEEEDAAGLGGFQTRAAFLEVAPKPVHGAGSDGHDSVLSSLPLSDSEHGSRGVDVVGVDIKERPALRRQLVETAPEDLGRKPVGGLDVGQRGTDAVTSHPVLFLRALVLMEQGDDVDQGEVLLVIAARSGAVGREGEALRELIHDGDRLQEALGVLHERDDLLAALSGLQARERASGALGFLDRFGLLLRFVHAQDETAVHEFFVDVDRGGCECDRGGAFDMVFLGFHPAGLRVLPGARDGELALGLE